jgi:excinuclease ABC subunit B
MLSEGDEDVAAVISSLEEEMLEAARNLEFEKAALLRDQIAVLKKDMPAEDLNKRGYKKKFRRKPIQ